MVPPLSALSLALYHEALEGGGNQQMGTIKSQKETSPLAHFVRNSLPHKSFRFCSPMRNIWNQQLEPANGNQQMKPANGNHQIAKRNFPSCSLCSQFTASQKLPLLFPNAKTYGASNWKPGDVLARYRTIC